VALDGWLHSISQHFRRRRMQRFAKDLAITPETLVLDVGGTPGCWDLLSARPRVVLLNTPRTKEELSAAASWVAGDGCSLPFRDQAFDVVFSNSVIEHVGDAANQRRFASEVARVGRGFWVQTPNRWFPVEQHLLTPLIHLLPRSWQLRIVPRFSVWAAVTRATPDRRRFYLEHYLRDIRLLGPAEFHALFPGATVLRERLLGLTKSMVAIKHAHGRPDSRLNPGRSEVR
jgi:SAM-dependent methyltransferase